jgi:GNAT superfamily N-acetyltransferase
MESMHLETLKPSDWRVLRDVRLEALLDSPHVFTSSYALESRWGQPEWLATFIDATWIVAREENRVIGLARSIREPKLPEVRYVESIWVAPIHRKRGVCRALLHDIAKREREAAVEELRLWVLEHNRDAYSAYLALGFEPTGAPHFLQAVQQCEQQLTLGIDRLLELETSRGPFAISNHSAEVSSSPSLQLQ